VNPQELTGQARTHVVALAEPSCTMHVHAVAPFMNLHRAARADGLDLRPVSGFRDFDRQLAIWNGKFSGERPLLDAAGRAIDASRLSPPERVAAILRWSALPGASRHHWGTDVDLIDANAIAPGYQVQLSVAEYSDSGPFARLAGWLGVHAPRFGFFRPYRGVLSGVEAEPWHFSFAPVAETARRALSPSVLRAVLSSAPLLGKEHVLARLDELHARYVAAIDWP
jgi:LAS superfamily LD-carboxypeptidase LdcB